MAVTTILIACAVAFIVTAGLLLWHGRFGQRHLVWTMRMGEESIIRYSIQPHQNENIAA
jgi:hypothetical protein